MFGIYNLSSVVTVSPLGGLGNHFGNVLSGIQGFSGLDFGGDVVFEEESPGHETYIEKEVDPSSDGQLIRTGNITMY